MNTQLLDLMTKMYIEMQEMKSDVSSMMTDMHEIKSDMLSMKSDLLDIKSYLKDMNAHAEATTQDTQELKNTQDKMARHLTGKIDALFDSREDQIDVDEKVALSLQKVEHKIDKLELKLIKNIFSDR